MTGAFDEQIEYHWPTPEELERFMIGAAAGDPFSILFLQLHDAHKAAMQDRAAYDTASAAARSAPHVVTASTTTLSHLAPHVSHHGLSAHG
jgi:hypothetical protein